ncbi:MAG: hypothetical protein ACFB9M_03495 [Myxococcota bacterium]
MGKWFLWKTDEEMERERREEARLRAILGLSAVGVALVLGGLAWFYRDELRRLTAREGKDASLTGWTRATVSPPQDDARFENQQDGHLETTS